MEKILFSLLLSDIKQWGLTIAYSSGTNITLPVSMNILRHMCAVTNGNKIQYFVGSNITNNVLIIYSNNDNEGVSTSWIAIGQ